MPLKTKKHRKQQLPRGVKKHSFEKVYWPYLPLIVILSAVLVFSSLSNVSAGRKIGQRKVMAYATSMSISGLLSATNSQRAANSKAALTINSKLNAAAQNKANDMAARDYWSHNTPEGNPPWIFSDAQGYTYYKIGENLATGYDDEAATITAWMNSPSHRDNMLDSEFSEVGFGFANIANYTAVGGGPMTIISAFYGKPQVASATNSSPAPTPAPSSPNPAATPSTSKSSTQPKTTASNSSGLTVSAAPTPKNEVTSTDKKQTPTSSNTNKSSPFTSSSTKEPASKALTQLQIAIDDPESVTAIAAAVTTLMIGIGGLWSSRHALRLRKMVINGESYVMHHPEVDVVLLALLALGYALMQTAGFIR